METFFGIMFLCWNWNFIIHVWDINGEGNGTPLQYSCLENPMDGGAWKAAVHGVTEGLDTTEPLKWTELNWIDTQM